MPCDRRVILHLLGCHVMAQQGIRRTVDFCVVATHTYGTPIYLRPKPRIYSIVRNTVEIRVGAMPTNVVIIYKISHCPVRIVGSNFSVESR